MVTRKIIQQSQIWLLGLVLGLVLVGVPLALRAIPVGEAPQAFKSYTFGISQYELFFGFKAQLLTLAGVAAAILLIFNRSFLSRHGPASRFRADPLVWCLGGWIVATTTSSLRSQHPDVIWYGGLMQRDGLGVQWTYGVLWLVGYHGSQSIHFKRCILWCLGVSTLLMGVLGWCSIDGISFANNELFKFLVIPKGLKDSMALTQLGLGGISGFLGNPNDTALLSALLVPFWASQLVFSRGFAASLIYGGLTTIALASALSSAGVAGAFGWMIGLVSLVVVAWRHRHSLQLMVIPGFVVAISVGGLFVHGMYPQVLPGFRTKPIQVLTLFDQMSESFLRHLGFNRNSGFSNKKLASEGAIYLAGERLYVTHWQPGFIIERLPQGVRFMDLGFRPLLVEAQGFRFRVKDLHFLDITIDQQRIPADPGPGLSYDLYRIEKGDQHFTFASTSSGLRVLVNDSLVKPIQGRRLDLPIDDHLLSHRIYIWARLIPVILDRWLLGHGVGSFILDFPNRDVISMAKTFGQGVFVDRPHNIYLQQAYHCGILGLVGFVLLLWGGVFRSLYKILWTPLTTTSNLSSLATGVTLGLLGVAVAGCGYDIGVSLGGTFWLLMGTLGGLSGLGTDSMVKYHRKHAWN